MPPDSPRDPRRATQARGATFPRDVRPDGTLPPAVQYDRDAAAYPDSGVIDGPLVDALIARADGLSDRFDALVAAIRAITPRDPIEETPVLTQGGAYLIQKRGRRHVKVFASAAVNVALGGSLPAVASFALAIGWNAVDWPEGTTVGTTNATPLAVFVRYYDDPN